MNNSTDIFKLIFEHDIRLDKLAERGEKLPDTASIEDFMKPDPTFSKIYLTGTDLAKKQFGLSVLRAYPQIFEKLQEGFNTSDFRTAKGSHEHLTDAVDAIKAGEVIVINGEQANLDNIPGLFVDDNSNVGHLKTELKTFLEKGAVVVYKEKAQNGYDLHIFSMENIYKDLFYPLKELVPDWFRFFSINGKRVSSERHFYFETWTLNKPPHGFEEVFPETVL